VTTWTLIDSKDAPASNVFDFPSLTFTGYEVVQVICSGIVVTTDATDIALTLYVASVEITANYRWGMNGVASGGGTVDDGDVSDPAILLTSNNANWDVGNASGEGFDCLIQIDQPLSSTLYKKVGFSTIATGPTGVVYAQQGIGLMENTGAITGLKIAGTSNLTAGKVRILGLA
jgi:hypothetical protein